MVTCTSNIPRERLCINASDGEYTLQLHALCSVLISGKRTMVKELERRLVNSLYGALLIVCEKAGRKLITGINDVT